MLVSYIVATSAFAKGILIGFAAAAAMKKCTDRWKEEER